MRINPSNESETGFVCIYHVKTVDIIPQDLYQWTPRVYVHKFLCEIHVTWPLKAAPANPSGALSSRLDHFTMRRSSSDSWKMGSIHSAKLFCAPCKNQVICEIYWNPEQDSQQHGVKFEKRRWESSRNFPEKLLITKMDLTQRTVCDFNAGWRPQHPKLLLLPGGKAESGQAKASKLTSGPEIIFQDLLIMDVAARGIGLEPGWPSNLSSCIESNVVTATKTLKPKQWDLTRMKSIPATLQLSTCGHKLEVKNDSSTHHTVPLPCWKPISAEAAMPRGVQSTSSQQRGWEKQQALQFESNQVMDGVKW